MMMAVPHRPSPSIPMPRLPPAVYFRLAGWILGTAHGLFRAGLIDRRGMLAALKGYHLISRLGMRAWRAERRRLLR